MPDQVSLPPQRDAVESAVLSWLEAHHQELVDRTAHLLRIESVEAAPQPGQPFGAGVGAALQFVEHLARELGLEAANVDGYAVHAHWGPPEPLVAILTHVDVVPAGEGWSVPPFGGVVLDGRIYGRGAIDNKGPTMASLFALAALAKAGAPVRRGLRLIVGGDEETGFECLRHYFKLQPYPELAFSPDAVFPVVFAEKGICDLTLAVPFSSPAVRSLWGGQRPNVVPDHAEACLQLPAGESSDRWRDRLAAAASKRRARITVQDAREDPAALSVTSQGVATHGSTPEKGINAVAELLACLVEADAGRGLLDPLGALAFLARAGSGIHGEGLGIATRDDLSGVLTCNLGVLRLQAGELQATFNIRYPVSLASAAGLTAKAAEEARAAGGRLVHVSDDPPHYVAEDSFLVRTLLEVYRRETGDEETPPLAIGGGTYARLVPGAVAFGPVLPFSGIVPHEKDENIEIRHLHRLARLYAAALWALAR